MRGVTGRSAAVARLLWEQNVAGSIPAVPIALRGNNLSDTGVQLALPPLKSFFIERPSSDSFFVAQARFLLKDRVQTRFLSYGGKLAFDRAEGNELILNNIVRFERIAVAA